MSVSRRQFVNSLGLGGAGLLAAPALIGRGREATTAAFAPWIDGSPFAAQSSLIRLDSNENPNGPSARAIEALRSALGEANRYPDSPEDQLREAIAKEHGVRAENIVLGCGSGETLRQCVEAYTSATAALVRW
jgi:histidinol-phosphate/aromatic aminotransferase/cobyric acid decarboxylase-like protein